jgi:hypothetical protein
MAKRQYIGDSSPPSHPLMLKSAGYRSSLMAHFAQPRSKSMPRHAITLIQIISI